MGEADRRALLLDVSGDDAETNLGHLFQFGVPGAARRAVPGLQPIQQVHHSLKDLQHNTDDNKQTKQQNRANLLCHAYNIHDDRSHSGHSIVILKARHSNVGKVEFAFPHLLIQVIGKYVN